MDETRPLTDPVDPAAPATAPAPAPACPGGDGAVLITGDLDVATIGPVRQQVFDLIGSGATDLVLDLSGVTFMDSSGITLLLQCRARATLVIRAPSTAVRRILALTGVAELLTISD